MLRAHANPFLYRNKLSRESIFCDKASDWLTKRALIMLNFWRNNRQKDDYPIYKRMATAPKTRTLTAEDGQIVFEVDMATAPKTRTLTATRVRGCWACYSRAAETTSWKSRSKMELTASFQLVENELNNYCLDSFFERQPFSDTDEWGKISCFIVS